MFKRMDGEKVRNEAFLTDFSDLTSPNYTIAKEWVAFFADALWSRHAIFLPREERKIA